MPHNKPNRRLGQPAVPADDHSATRVTDTLSDCGASGTDPREVGDLLGLWLGIKMDEVDAAVETARDKMAAIPDWRVLSTLLGELTIRVHALGLEVDQLRKGRRP